MTVVRRTSWWFRVNGVDVCEFWIESLGRPAWTVPHSYVFFKTLWGCAVIARRALHPEACLCDPCVARYC